jgi:hypothetical protein
MCRKRPTLREFQPHEIPQPMSRKEKILALRILKVVRSVEAQRQRLLQAGHPPAQVESFLSGLRGPLRKK